MSRPTITGLAALLCVLLWHTPAAAVPPWPLGPLVPWHAPMGVPMATYELDTSGWEVGTAPTSANVGVSAGGSITTSDDWYYGEDTDGLYLANHMASGDGGANGCELILTSNANVNAGASASGEALHIWWEMKWVLDDDDGVDDTVTIIPWRPGSMGRFTLGYGNSAFHNNNHGEFGNLNAVTGDGQKRGQHIQLDRKYRFDFWAIPRGTNDVDCFVTVNNRTFFVNDAFSSNLMNNCQRLLWDPDIDNTGAQRVSQRLYSMGAETFASGGADNYEAATLDTSDDDVWVMGNAIAPNAAAQTYADGAYEWSVSAGTPDHRHNTYTTTDDREKVYAYEFPSTAACVGTGRELRVPPSWKGRGAVGCIVHVGSGPIDLDLVDASGDIVAGIGIPDSNSAKQISLRRGSGPVLEELTGINVTPGNWYEIVMHHGDGKPLSLTVQYFGTGTNWAAANTDRVMWTYKSTTLSGWISEAVRPKITVGTASAGTEPYVTRGMIAAERWQWVLVSSYVANGLSSGTDPANYQTTGNVADEGLCPWGDILPGGGRVTFPAVGGWRGAGILGRSGGAFINRSSGVAEFRVEGLGDVSYSDFFSAGHAARLDLWDIVINSLSTLDDLETSTARADAVVAELELLIAAAAEHEVELVLIEQVPPYDENTGEGSPPTNWNADRSALLISVVNRVKVLVQQYSRGNMRIGTAYDPTRTLAENQTDIMESGDVHPAKDRLMYTRGWGSAELVQGERNRTRDRGR